MKKTLSEKKRKENLSLIERQVKGLGVKVSGGKLLYAGLRLKGGQCVFREEPWLVIDRNLPYEEQLEQYREALKTLAIDPKNLSPAVKDILFPGVFPELATEPANTAEPATGQSKESPDGDDEPGD